eukprot:8122341-Pyramimonas_sp.AAC.1
MAGGGSDSDDMDFRTRLSGRRTRLEVVTPAEAEERLAMARSAREAGNALFTQKRAADASASYSQALRFLEFHPPNAKTRADHAEASAMCLLNSAACCLSLKLPLQAVQACMAVLRMQPENVKAHLRVVQ